MPPMPTYKELFERPFGPWLEHIVLNQKWQTSIKDVLTLEDVLLTQGNDVVGSVFSSRLVRTPV
jgi:hypothetical protein